MPASTSKSPRSSKRRILLRAYPGASRRSRTAVRPSRASAVAIAMGRFSVRARWTRQYYYSPRAARCNFLDTQVRFSPEWTSLNLAEGILRATTHFFACMDAWLSPPQTSTPQEESHHFPIPMANVGNPMAIGIKNTMSMRIVNGLKLAMKARRVTYGELGRRIQLSEPL